MPPLVAASKPLDILVRGVGLGWDPSGAQKMKKHPFKLRREIISKVSSRQSKNNKSLQVRVIIVKKYQNPLYNTLNSIVPFERS